MNDAAKLKSIKILHTLIWIFFNKANFDIYLPNWLARYNKQIYTSIVLIAIVILIYRLAN
jgi:hypothetical protein